MDVTPVINNSKPHPPTEVRLNAKNKKESTVKRKLKVSTPSAQAMAHAIPLRSF